ncbi:uncharacterized protein rab44 [Melanotaenia boesemani]|uniref:uncharacterized protein rab44 n=1 Tax=Melanotaenia boesemani TaxID=1250792 RepID=UPI001C04E662|nr:uncharacterized protein rab44 [Melanotaenia boesemani]
MSKRKLGSSRRNKGKPLTKDPETEPYLEPREDFEDETRGKETLRTHVSAAAQLDSTMFTSFSPDGSVVKMTTVSPDDIMESLMPKTSNLQTSNTVSKLKETDESNFLESEEVKENTPFDGLSEAPNSSIFSCVSVNQQLMNKKAANSNTHAAAKSESNNKGVRDLFRQDGSLQGNHMVSESQISSLVLESAKPEITTDKSSPSEITKVKNSVGQAVLLSPKEELPTNEEHDDFAQHSEDGVDKVHEKDDKPTQIQGFISTPYAKQDLCPNKGNLKAADQRNEADDLKQKGNNTEAEKTDVGQMYEGGVHVEDGVKQSVKQTVHQGDLFEDERINSALQTLPSETYAHFDSQNRRKYGSRRRNKGQQHLKESEEEVLEHDKCDQALEKEKILEASTTSQGDLSQDTGHDVIFSVSHGSSMFSLTAPADVENSLPENFILTSENVPEDQNERETEINVDLSDKSAKVMPEETDQSSTLYSEDTKGVHHSEDAEKVQEDEVHPTQMQEVLQTKNCSEAVTDNVSENPEISESLIDPFEITNQSDPTEKSTDECAAKQEVSTQLVVKQNDFPTTERNLQAVDQRNIKTTMAQMHQDRKYNSGQSVPQNEDHVFFESQTSNISPQTQSSALPDSVSMDEQTHTFFSQTGNRGDPHSEDAAEKVQEDEVNPAQMQEILQNDYSPETLLNDSSVNLEIASGILTDQAEITNAYQSEFTVNRTDDPATKETASNQEDKPNEDSTEQDFSEALDLKNEDYELCGVNKPPISDIENSAPSQVHEFKEGDVEPNTDQIFHQEEEGPLYETEEMKSADHQPQDSFVSVDENNHTDVHHSSNRRKLGSSRRNKGKYKVKESVVEAYHKIRKDAGANSSSNESSEAVLTVEMAGQEKSVENVQEEEEKAGPFQTEVVNFDSDVCTSEIPPIDVHSASTEDQSVFEKSRYGLVPGEDFSSVYSITGTVSKDRLECTKLLSGDGNLQENYLVCEQLVCPIAQEIHLEKSSSGEYVKDECRVEKGSPEDELPMKEKQLSSSQQKELEQETEPTQMQGVSQISFITDTNEKKEKKSGDVYEVEGQVVIINPSDKEMGHQVMEGLFSESGRTESPLQSLQNQTHAVLDSQSQQNDTSLILAGNSGVVGSSLEKSPERRKEGIETSDTSPTDNMAAHCKENAHLGTVAGICEFTTSSPSVKQQLIKSNSRKLPDDKLPSVFATENKKPDEDTEKLRPCGNLQGNHLPSENVEFSIPPERTTERSKYNAEVKTFLSQENFPTNGKQDEHFNSSKAERAMHSEDVTRKHDVHIDQAMHQLNYTTILEENPSVQTRQSDTDMTPLDSQPQDSCMSFKDERHSGVKLAGNRRKLGSTRKDKTRQQTKVTKANQEFKEEVVEDTEMLAANKTKQEESEDLLSAGTVKISSTMSGDKNTEKLIKVLDNSAVATSDINPDSDNGDPLKFNKDLDERHTKLVKEPDNVSQFTGYDTVKLMQSSQACDGEDDSDVQSILYHDYIISPRSGSEHVPDHKAAFQCHNTEVLSCDKNSQGQEVHSQQADDVMETVRCVTTEDCKTEVASSMDAQGPDQDEAVGEHVQEMDASLESEISTPMDVHNRLQEKTQSGYNENLQVKSKEKKRKLGSTRRSRLNRKQEEDTDSKESDFNTEDEVRDLDKLEVVEELSLTAEVLQSEHGQPLQHTLKQEKTEEIKTLHHEEHTLQSCAFDKQSSESKVIPASLSEQSASIKPVAFRMAANERDEERNVDKISQLDDFTNTEIQLTSGTNSSTLSQLLPLITETSTGISMQTHEESLKPAQVQDADEQKPSNLHEGSKCENLEITSSSPDLNSPKRRRKLGSTRKNLSSQTRKEGLNQQQELENKPTETTATSENMMAEGASRMEEKDLQLYVEHKDSDSDQRKDHFFAEAEISHVVKSLSMLPVEETAKESPVSQSHFTEPEHHLTPETESTQSTSPKTDTLSELASGGRRRKLGSNRKSHLHQSNKDQTAREARIINSQNENDVKEEDAHKATEEPREESPGLDKRSQVDESDKKTLSFNTSKPASEKIPVQSEIRFGQETQREIFYADPRRTDLSSNSYNVVMVGDSCVGKTSFMKRAQNGKFSLDLPASVGLDSCTWTVLVEGKPVVLQLWDTAGQERFRSITKQIFHKAQAFLLMYDITSSQSFSAISYWANSIQESAAENVTVLLLGNKSDHARRQVKTEQGEILAKEYNYGFLECSAATGENVIQALEIVASMLSQRADFREEATVLHKEPVQKKRSTCC